MKKFRLRSFTMGNTVSIPHLPTLKEQVIEAYGGKCSCCGETNFDCLQVHHSLGDGVRHRKEVRSTNADLKRKGFPKDLGIEILCANCHACVTVRGHCTMAHPNQITKEQ